MTMSAIVRESESAVGAERAMLMNAYAHPVSGNIWNAAGFMNKLSAQSSLNASELEQKQV